MAQPKPQLEKDSVRVDPRHYTVDMENDEVRIVRARYAPGEKSVMHGHPAAVAIFLTDCKVRMTYPDGRTEEMDVRAGQTQFTPAQEHLPENLSDHTIEVIVVELKQ